MIMETGKSETCRVNWQAGGRGEGSCCGESLKANGLRPRKESIFKVSSLFLRKSQPFVLFRPLTDSMRPTHTI